MNSLQWILLLVAFPIGAFFSLLGWGLVQTGSTPGNVGVNNTLGEVHVDSKPAPDFRIMTLDGIELNPQSLRDKVVMIDFWSSWCPPCRLEAPILSQIYREYENRPVAFVGIAVWDDPKKIVGFIDEFDVTYHNAIDSEGRMAIDYGVVRLPIKYFMDGNGNIVRKFDGPMNASALRHVLDEMLAEEEATIITSPTQKQDKMHP